MALVSYDYDSASENENEEKDLPSTIKESSVFSIQRNNSPPLLKQTAFNGDTGNALFANLPQTKTFVKSLVEGQIEDFIPKLKSVYKGKQKIKITVPSLSDFDDIDDEPPSKKQKPCIKGSGLISLLPPIKGSIKTAKSFVPNIISQKKNNCSVIKSNSLVPCAVRKRAEMNQFDIVQRIQKEKQKQEVESDDDLEMPETFDDEMWQKVCGRPKLKLILHEPEQLHEEMINIAPEPEKPYDGLDNKAFKELVGKSKRPVGNIKLIDINEEEILPEKDLWMAKFLTDPEMAPKSKIEDPVDLTRRKKHHITYLAQQAKANEQELQNAWAASKNNRLASRAKYGF